MWFAESALYAEDDVSYSAGATQKQKNINSFSVKTLWECNFNRGVKLRTVSHWNYFNSDFLT